MIERVAFDGLKGVLDPELLAELDKRLGDWILITADDRLPSAHASTIARLRPTIATIILAAHRRQLDAWLREIVHRWATNEEQPAHTIRRYGPSAHRLWTPIR